MQRVLTRVIDAYRVAAVEDELNKLMESGRWRLMRLDVQPLPWEGGTNRDPLMQPANGLTPPAAVLVAVLEDQGAAREALLSRLQQTPTGAPGAVVTKQVPDL